VNKPEFVEERPFILQFFKFFKKLIKPSFRGHLRLSNGILPSKLATASSSYGQKKNLAKVFKRPLSQTMNTIAKIPPINSNFS
jgi:hypothetical protein